MENYIVINGKKAELTAEQLKQLGINIEKKLADVPAGEIANIKGCDWIVLEHTENGTLCLTKNFTEGDIQFDKNSNNFAESSIRDKLNDFVNRVKKQVGSENVCEFLLDLTSDDGLDDYGTISTEVGLLTCDQYRKYNRIIEKYPVNGWWWLATPCSTSHRGYSYSVCCVNHVGTLYRLNCDVHLGIRLFCIFKSDIFVS